MGKTTLSALVVRELIARKATPILAVDADPNSNLNEALGVTYDATIADLREDLQGKELPPSTSKSDYITKKLQEALVEQAGFDLLVMGRPECRGCYCFVNELLRQFLSKLSGPYKYVVIDNEAGMEHLSRRTTDNIDLLLIASDQTLVGIRSARRVAELAKCLKLNIKKAYVVLNRAKPAQTDAQQLEIGNIGVPLLGTVPDDDAINSYRESGKGLLDLPDSPATLAVRELLKKGELWNM